MNWRAGMKCPNCNKEMKDESYWTFSMAGWDLDYPDCIVRKYSCEECGIKFNSSDYITSIPDYEGIIDQKIYFRK